MTKNTSTQTPPAAPVVSTYCGDYAGDHAGCPSSVECHRASDQIGAEVAGIRPSETTGPVTVASLKAVGRGERLIPVMATYVVETFPSAKPEDVVGIVHLLATGCSCPTGKGKTCSCGLRPAQKMGKGKDAQATDYGRGVDSLVSAIKRMMKVAPALPEVATITITLGKTLTAPGQTVTIKADDPRYVDALGLLAAAAAAAV